MTPSMYKNTVNKHKQEAYVENKLERGLYYINRYMISLSLKGFNFRT